MTMPTFDAEATPELTEARLARVRELPFHRYLGLELSHVAPGHARLRLPAGSAAANPLGIVHGGVIYALLDVACYAAAAALMPDGTDAVTHDIHCSVLRSASAAQDVWFEGHVLRAGKSLIFGQSEATMDGKLVARATVTKSRIAHAR